MQDTPSFETFKSNVCHRVKNIGDLPFIIETLISNEIRILYEQKRYPEALYLLAMVDYLSRENDLPICSECRDIRSHKLSRIIYPGSIIAYAISMGDESIKEESYDNAIPEFKRLISYKMRCAMSSNERSFCVTPEDTQCCRNLSANSFAAASQSRSSEINMKNFFLLLFIVLQSKNKSKILLFQILCCIGFQNMIVYIMNVTKHGVA